ncbi:Mitogen-activated protein kinase kinase kinase 13-A [Leucoagaricus sp. SymC.cos]|nr:Mitogen-activated protein kinase kinase kinase 13-A [Leucoagaricus sp. SymC.cos]
MLKAIPAPADVSPQAEASTTLTNNPEFLTLPPHYAAANFPSTIRDTAPSLSWDFDPWKGVDSSTKHNASGAMIKGLESPEIRGTVGVGYVSSKSDDSINEAQSELLEMLSSILLDNDQRKSLTKMQGDDAQVMIEYLNSILLEPDLPEPWLRRHCLIALYKLSRSSRLYPECYVLKNSIDRGICETYGGFSDIYKGKFGEKELCLKVLRLHKADTELVLKRYAKEAILWGNLDHPNIVPLYGMYYFDDMRQQLCLVSPWMSHGDIAGYLKRNESVPRLPLVYDVVCGLDYLHDLGLIHSDLKSPNILINHLEQACITDFGTTFVRTDQTLAHMATPTPTAHGFSQRWASPELMEEDARPTMASDIWALGCVCLEIMTGELPYAELKRDAQVLNKLIHGRAPSRPQVVSNSGEKIVWSQVDKCWRKEPQERPQCRDILLHLESAGIKREPRKRHQRGGILLQLRSKLKKDDDHQEDAEQNSFYLKGDMRKGNGGRVNVTRAGDILSGLSGAVEVIDDDVFAMDDISSHSDIFEVESEADSDWEAQPIVHAVGTSEIEEDFFSEDEGEFTGEPESAWESSVSDDGGNWEVCNTLTLGLQAQVADNVSSGVFSAHECEGSVACIEVSKPGGDVVITKSALIGRGISGNLGKAHPSSTIRMTVPRGFNNDGGDFDGGNSTPCVGSLTTLVKPVVTSAVLDSSQTHVFNNVGSVYLPLDPDIAKGLGSEGGMMAETAKIKEELMVEDKERVWECDKMPFDGIDPAASKPKWGFAIEADIDGTTHHGTHRIRVEQDPSPHPDNPLPASPSPNHQVSNQMPNSHADNPVLITI